MRLIRLIEGTSGARARARCFTTHVSRDSALCPGRCQSTAEDVPFYNFPSLLFLFTADIFKDVIHSF